MVSLLTEVLASRKIINPGGDLIMKQLLSGLVAGVALAGAALFAAPAEAEYPERPITVIVPWAAGGGTDEIGRASCRASVCQYVLISGVAGSLKKKRSKKHNKQ